MATTPPSPFAPFASTLFYVGPNVGRNVEHNYDFIFQAVNTSEMRWRRFQCICEHLASQAAADDAVITFDFVNYTANAIDDTWDDNDYNSVAGHMVTYLQAWAPHMAANHSFTKIKAYAMQFNDDWKDSPTDTDIKPFQDSGPPEYEATISIPGSGAGGIPPQVSLSLSEQTPIRRHWGRHYLPFPAGTVLTSTGERISATVVDAVVEAAEVFYRASAIVELYPVIPQQTHEKKRVAALSHVTAVSMDDVPDIIRRRRPKFSLYRKVLPVPTPLEPSTLPAPATA